MKEKRRNFVIKKSSSEACEDVMKKNPQYDAFRLLCGMVWQSRPAQVCIKLYD